MAISYNKSASVEHIVTVDNETSMFGLQRMESHGVRTVGFELGL
jgi:hypothetical protein